MMYFRTNHNFPFSRVHFHSNMSFDPNQEPLIEETLLKKRRSLDELALRRATTLSVQNKKRKNVRGEVIKLKRPEQFVTQSRIKEGSERKMKRRKSQVEAKTKASLIPKDQKMKDSVGFAVRIHAGKHSSPLIKEQLNKLGLNKKYDAVFCELDREGIAKLKPLDAYVAYGYISKKSVVELVHRRAYIKMEGTRKPLSDNITVENILGDKNIICLSDMSHEIYTVGPNFKSAINTLETFKLSAPVGSYEKKILHVNDKVEEKGGFLGEVMDEFLLKIL